MFTRPILDPGGRGPTRIHGGLGVNLGGIWATLATVLGLVAIGLVAVWGVLSNTLCTVIILICPSTSGTTSSSPASRCRAIDINFMDTTPRGADGGLVQLPNNLFSQKVIKRRRGQAGVSSRISTARIIRRRLEESRLNHA